MDRPGSRWKLAPSETLRFEVAVPAAARPGERWWAIVKLMYFGRLRYTEPAEVTVAAPGD